MKSQEKEFELNKENFMLLRNGLYSKNVISKVVTGDIITGEEHEAIKISDAGGGKLVFPKVE